MRILHINSLYEPRIIGGAEKSVRLLSESLQANGHSVTVIVPSHRPHIRTLSGVTIRGVVIPFTRDPFNVRIKGSPFVRRFAKLQDIWNPFAKSVIKAVLRAERPDIVHTHTLYGISAVVWQCAASLGIPVVHTFRDYFFLDWAYMRSCKVTATQSLLIATYQRFQRRMLRDVDLLVFLSRRQRDIMRIIVGTRETAIIPNSMAPIQSKSSPAPKRKNDSERNTFVFLFLGRLDHKKGVSVLVDAFSQSHRGDIRLVIAGRGDLEKFVQRKASRDDRISFVGWVVDSETAELLAQADVLVAPSIYDEPFGRSAVEAYRHGKPIIASAVGGFLDTVVNFETGLLVTPCDVNELCRAIEYMADHDTLRKMAKRVFDFRDRFSPITVAKHYEKIYNRLVGSKN